jgi:hypothetical protein
MDEALDPAFNSLLAKIGSELGSFSHQLLRCVAFPKDVVLLKEGSKISEVVPSHFSVVKCDTSTHRVFTVPALLCISSRQHVKQRRLA